MKKIIYIISLALFGVFFVQCDKEYDDLVTENAKYGGLIDVNNAAINYVVGDGGSYSYKLFVHQNSDAVIKKVNVYKSFYSGPIAWSDPSDTTHATSDSIPAMWSNSVLQESIDITENTSHWITATALNYSDLTANLQINGANLPASDSDLKIGDYFNFVLESELENGRVVTQAYNVKMTVSTRFAGSYKCVEGYYFRIGVLTYSASDWPEVTQIESVDAKTYKIVEYFGPFEGNELYFQIQDDGSITYPAEWAGVAQTGNGLPLITCELNAQDMTNVNCGSSNYIIKDNVNGKDRLIMSFGYYTAGSGPREFYQVMEKL